MQLYMIHRTVEIKLLLLCWGKICNIFFSQKTLTFSIATIVFSLEIKIEYLIIKCKKIFSEYLNTIKVSWLANLFSKHYLQGFLPFPESSLKMCDCACFRSLTWNIDKERRTKLFYCRWNRRDHPTMHQLIWP